MFMLLLWMNGDGVAALSEDYNLGDHLLNSDIPTLSAVGRYSEHAFVQYSTPLTDQEQLRSKMAGSYHFCFVGRMAQLMGHEKCRRSWER
jgi:hypothetical protein